MVEKNEVKSRNTYNVTAEDFIETWQTSSTADEVATRLKMPKAIIHARTSNYRTAGVKLKKMARRPHNKLDIEALNKRIEELEGRAE